VCAVGLNIEIFIKTPLICRVSYFNLRGLGALFGGISPPKPLHGDETVPSHSPEGTLYLL